MKIKRAGAVGLAVGAIGVVFGDIGTSPLYALPTVFEAAKLPVTPITVYGLVSLIIWTLIVVVFIKYIGFIMKADNRGEGGIMALVSQLQKATISKKNKLFLVLIGLAGMALFYGDSIITPAISVLSAVEGIKLIQPSLEAYVVPITLAILVFLFVIQSRGSGSIGKLFGPIMTIWFLVVASGGLFNIIQQPSSLIALLPTSALAFLLQHPIAGFSVLGAVVLAITGAEALYADMGHFGRGAIKRAWIFLVFPALLLNYIGQGVVILAASSTHLAASPFFMLYPSSIQPIIVFIATVATLIASQSVISGAFSLTHQAVQLGYMPRMAVRYTSRSQEGQVYVPFINWFLCAAVCTLVIIFGSSAKLAAAYGIAVSGALLIDTLLFVAILARVKHASIVKTALFATIFIMIDLLFVASTSLKIIAGGWIPLLVAILTCLLLFTWVKGHSAVVHERHKQEQPLDDFVTSIKGKKLARLPGTAVYLGSHNGYAPLALETSVHQLHELHKKVVVVTVEVAHRPHVPEKDRIVFDSLHTSADDISHVTIRYGFSDHPNVPKALLHARTINPEINFNPYTATYFVSEQKPVIESNHRMSRIQKHLYMFMARNALNASDYYHLPPNNTIQMSTYVGL